VLLLNPGSFRNRIDRLVEDGAFTRNIAKAAMAAPRRLHGSPNESAKNVAGSNPRNVADKLTCSIIDSREASTLASSPPRRLPRPLARLPKPANAPAICAMTG